MLIATSFLLHSNTLQDIILGCDILQKINAVVDFGLAGENDTLFVDGYDKEKCRGKLTVRIDLRESGIDDSRAGNVRDGSNDLFTMEIPLFWLDEQEVNSEREKERSQHL